MQDNMRRPGLHGYSIMSTIQLRLSERRTMAVHRDDERRLPAARPKFQFPRVEFWYILAAQPEVSMDRPSLRREFLRRSIAIASSALALNPTRALASGEVQRKAGVKIKIGLNSYSFNRPLMAHEMTLEDVIDYCAAHNIDG